MWRPRNRLGFTLVETIVVMMLLSLLTTATIVLLSAVGARTRRNEVERDNLDELRRAICEIRREMGNSQGNAVSCAANQVIFPGALIEQPQPLAVDAEGDFLCRRWVCYSLNPATASLWRSDLPGSQTDIAGLAPVVNLFTKRVVVARNILAFSCTPASLPKLFSMTLKVGQSDNFYTLNSQVGTRN